MNGLIVIGFLFVVYALIRLMTPQWSVERILDELTRDLPDRGY